MLDEMDLRAIQGMMTDLKKDIMHGVSILMEAEVTPKFNLLAEGHQTILEKLVPRSRVDELEEELRFLKSVVRQMNEDLQALKKAN